MIIKSRFLAILLFAILYFNCNKECIMEDSIIGTWNWSYSFGGFGGDTITPAIVGYSKRLEISRSHFREFINDSIVYESEYKIEVRSDTFFDTNRYIVFPLRFDYAIKVDCTELIIYDIHWFDSYDQHFVREK